MIFFKDNTRFAFEPNDEKPDNEWLEELGVYGTPIGFNDIVVLPRVDVSRLESKLSTYKACNTECDYCLEKFFDDIAPEDEVSPYAKHEFIRESILKYKPSAIELTGGELFQINNMKALDKMFEFLDEIDPENKITVEFISNGKEPLIAKKYFKNPRTYVSVSFDPVVGDNYRHISKDVVFETIKTLAEIDTSRLLVFWMVSSHADLEKVNPIINALNELNVRWTVQPVNDVQGFFVGNEKYDVDFVKELIDKVPSILDDYSLSRLFLPRISCYNGAVVVKAKNKVSTCIFREASDEYPEYDTVVEDTNKLTVSAGVSHVCSILTENKFPSNYMEIERMGYTLIGYNLSKQENPKEKTEAITALYHYMKDFKEKILTPSSAKHVGNKVAVDTQYPQTSVGQQAIVRMMEKVGIHIKNVTDETNMFEDDLWFKYEDGEDATVMLYEEYIQKWKGIDPQKPLVVTTFNNFPCRLIFYGRNVDISKCLYYNVNNIYPQMLSNAPNVIGMVFQHITGEIA